MLDFADKPYKYRPPYLSRVLIPIARVYNRKFHLPVLKKVISVEVSGLQTVRSARRSNSDSLLLLPNHPTHADPEIFFEALRQAGVSSRFMVAYEVFLRGRALGRI